MSETLDTASSPSLGAPSASGSASTPLAAGPSSSPMGRGPYALNRRRRALDLVLEYGIMVVLAILIVYFGVQSPYFFTLENAANIGSAMAVTGILAAGLTVALIAGQLDLTVGTVMGMTTTIFATLTVLDHISLLAAIAVAVGAGLALGLVNGVLVVNFGINSIIATIATNQFVLGVSLVTPNPHGQNIFLTDQTFQTLTNARPLGVPAPILVMAVVYVLLYVLLMHTKLGSHIYATGGNASAALRAGIPVTLLYRLVFLLTAVLAVLAGFIVLGRAGLGGPQVGTDVNTFDALTGVLLGGIGLSGGSGRLERTLAGVLLIGVLENGMTLVNVDSFFQTMVRGAVLVFAVVLGAINVKRKAR